MTTTSFRVPVASVQGTLALDLSPRHAPPPLPASASVLDADVVPIDPRHRLVTTKYNPARTWTAENSVGIGGAYLCIYGMEGPGGYQFVGRTTQVWDAVVRTEDRTIALFRCTQSVLWPR